MRSLALALLLLAALTAHPGLASAQAEPTQSLCQASETVLFNCEITTKLVSICGQGQERAIYRFGRPDRIELEATNLHRAEQGFSGGGETQVYFSTSTYRYIVYDQVVRTSFGDDGRHDPQERSGLIVQKDRKTIADQQCAMPGTFKRLIEALVPAGDYLPH